jgi:hypothetical protein
MSRIQRTFRAGNCRSATAVIVVFSSIAFGKTDVPLFLFSGQSNMVCLGSTVSGLTADQKKTVDNIKIDSRADNSTKTWATLGPGFGADASHFGPELLFGRTLSDSMPGKKIAFIKDATSGTYLGQTAGWLPPSSNNGTGGTLYKNMMTHIDKALASFNNAFDTAQYVPRWAGFVWLQGEFDGMDQALANKYETNLTNLIKDIRTKAGVEDLPVIIEMIKPISAWKYAATIRDAEVACTKKLKNVDTMDTKDLALSSDNVHYNTASMVKIGTISAQRWLNMHFNYGPPTPVFTHKYSQPATAPMQPRMTSLPVTDAFDLAGRRITVHGSMATPLGRTISPHCVLIAVTNRQGGAQCSEKMIVIGK